MNLRLEFKEIQFNKIQPPKTDLKEAIAALGFEYSFDPYLENESLLGEEACNLLLQTNPMILCKKEVVAGLRTFWLTSSKINDDTMVRVWILPPRTPRTTIIQYAQYCTLLASMHSAVERPRRTIFAAGRVSQQEGFLGETSTIFSFSQTQAAKVLNLTPKTLGKAMRK